MDLKKGGTRIQKTPGSIPAPHQTALTAPRPELPKVLEPTFLLK
jgi:hypothetical protein